MNEQVTLIRDCEAVEIPAGSTMVLKAGEIVTIAQSLGGSYTVTTAQGFMVRIDGHNADAIGKETTAPVEVKGTSEADVEHAVWEQLKTVFDPEIPVNIVDLGLVYECSLSDHPEGGKRVDIKMSMTAPGCGMGDVLKSDAESRVRSLAGVTDVTAEVVWEPPWDPSRMSEAAKLQLGM